MAAAVKSIIKNSVSETVVKVQGDSGSVTIDLDVDLLAATQSAVGTQVVNIVGVMWTGAPAGVASVTRDSVPVMTLPGTAPNALDFGGQIMTPENTNNTNDLVVAITGGQTEVWLRLKKVSGYVSSIETSVFGQYDNEEEVGE